MPQLDGIPYLSTQQVANILNLSKGTIKNWLRDKKISEPRRHPTNNYRLWTQQDVANLRLHIEEGKGDSAT